MITVRKVDGDYWEYWLEEGERALIKRLLGIKYDSVIMIVTIIRKGLDSRDLHTKFTEERTPDDDTADLFECRDADHT